MGFLSLLVSFISFGICFYLVSILQPVIEWAVHRYVLHPMGLKKGSFFHYHWEHHNRCRKNDNIDIEYVDMYKFKFSPMIKKEIFLMLLCNLITVPVFLFVLPELGLAMMVNQWVYFFVHAKSHTVPYKHNDFKVLDDCMIPSHGEHHMGPNQNMNWAITCAWPDRLFGTSTTMENMEKAE